MRGIDVGEGGSWWTLRAVRLSELARSYEGSGFSKWRN